MADDTIAISKVEYAAGKVLVHWVDGHESRFHPLWLRDNCHCEHCGNRAGGLKQNSLLDIATNIQPISTEITGSSLKIKWRPDGHVTRFEESWLRAHCYAESQRTARQHKPKLWDHRLKPLPKIAYEDFIGKEKSQFVLLKKVRDYGFSIIKGVPPNEDAFLNTLALIGFVKETNYGKISHLVARAGPPKTLSDSKHGIPMHTDECYRHANPGMLAFLCLSASEAEEGATLLADGFAVATHLRDTDRKSFDFLTRIPMTSRRLHPNEVDLCTQSPVIAVDFEGRIQGVRYNERSAAPLDLPEYLIESAYEALRAWLRISRDKRFLVRYLLCPGDLLVFDNQRVLHGRESFAGNRHLLYCQLDLDEPHSRVRILAERLGLSNEDLLTHRGV